MLKDQRRYHAKTVDQATDTDRAHGKAQHGAGVGQRGIGAGNAKFGLDDRQLHHERPHADAADGPKQRGGKEAKPGIGGFAVPVGAPKDWADLLMGAAQSRLGGPRSSRPAAVQGCILRGIRPGQLAAAQPLVPGRRRTMAAATMLRAIHRHSGAP